MSPIAGSSCNNCAENQRVQEEMFSLIREVKGCVVDLRGEIRQIRKQVKHMVNRNANEMHKVGRCLIDFVSCRLINQYQ